MVWTENNTVSLRQEFVHPARQEGANAGALCRQFGISPKTGNKWLGRFEAASGHVRALHATAGVQPALSGVKVRRVALRIVTAASAQRVASGHFLAFDAEGAGFRAPLPRTNF